ncbi:MAG TPA: LPS assembly lipoprotein LptE [Tabrizicola sp.]|nr:LPS assembly lipoprotein LptE [Tabrizicola sp.]
MSSSDRKLPDADAFAQGQGLLVTRRAVLAAPLFVAACGFSPAYGPGGSAGKLTESVWVQDPDTKNAFDLVERLEERLGRPENVRYDLAYTITTESVGVGITSDNKITRYNLKGVVDYFLTDRATGTRVTGGRVQSFTAYSATGSTVAQLAAEEDAALRLMRILADQIVARLIAASASLP